MPFVTLRVTDLRRAASLGQDAERPELHADAERRHDRCSLRHPSFLTVQRGNAVGDALRHRSAPRRKFGTGRGASRTACRRGASAR
ncbi:DUF1534 domain-containing protein [Pseudomonas syringae]|nr:DUF1534 domain-containing protein [Pseudomonas syringae]MCF5316031.1 DUF1534 domain-containing protein [Pseudomonas syringae]MCF5363642.1 DUF1534 domain-containing protein [Pseudomonas syringae]MCF5390808.1 DUF1534 domain-containing protein [Pseudomonas syringae]MCF5402464.1 DUF1534 domain-containing protein [Pseudomonas syringae]